MTLSTYNSKMVEQYLSRLGHLEAGGCTEIRILPKDRYLTINGKREYVGNIVAGYYTDYAKAAHDIAPFDGKANIYATINPCDIKLMRRSHNRLTFNAKTTASDKDILSILWFLFDADPVRPADTPSSEAELKAALERRDQIIREVFEPLGVPVIPPMSGNGGHGLIRLIGYSNTEETQAKIKRLLGWLSEMFSDDGVAVDRTVGNSARVLKVYGTVSVKGDDTPEAPYRRAFIELPKEPIEPVDMLGMLDEIIPADWKPINADSKQKTAASASASHGDYPLLDVKKWLTHYGYQFTEKAKEGVTFYNLDECPFNPDHKSPDAAITQDANGKLGFHCFHDSCADKGWQEAKAAIGDPKPFYEAFGAQKQPGQNRNGTDSSRLTPESALKALDQIEEKTPENIQKRVWDFVEDASHWNRVDRGRFCDDLNAEYNISKTWIKGWIGAVIEEARRHSACRATPENYADNGLPLINTTDRHLRDISQDALNALIQNNKINPRLYVRGGVLTRVKNYESAVIVSEVLTANALRGELARVADFVGGKDSERNPLHLPISPPTDVVNDLISLPEWEEIPVLKGIIHAPVFTRSGVLDTTPGYQSQSQMYYEPDNDFEIGPIHTTDEAVKDALSLIFDDLLGEFCFADQASRANALALMLLPFVRLLINGPTPLHLIDAPMEGSGKGLLADVLTYSFKPDGGTLMAEGESDEEWRKRITAALSEAPSHILIDNVSKRLDSGSLAAALTTKYWSDRLLGSNTIVKYPVTQTWIATGNNVEMSPEITRRTVWIRLRPAEEDPSQRQFKIENLRQWALDHRSELATACLTLIQKWVSAGMHRGNARKGSYEDWAAILSGILDAIGVDGFLGNYAHLNERANQESTAWRDFVATWYEEHGFANVGVADLFVIASTKKTIDDDGREVEIGRGLLNDYLRSNSERGRRIKLGDMLKNQVDRVYGEHRILNAGRLQGAAQYRLTSIGESRESHILDSQTDSRPYQSSNGAGSDTSRESRESKSAQDEKQGGAHISSNRNVENKTPDDMHPPSDVNLRQTDSRDSRPSHESTPELSSTPRESSRESQFSDSRDSRDSRDGIGGNGKQRELTRREKIIHIHDAENWLGLQRSPIDSRWSEEQIDALYDERLTKILGCWNRTGQGGLSRGNTQ